MKNAVKKEERPGQNRTNTADDVHSIINMIHDSPIIQEIIQGKGKPPSVILYTEEQLKDIVNICDDEKSPTILGIDRTFNLGSCFVTSFVFQHPNLVCTATQTKPVMLGPMYLHWDGSYNTNHGFFSNLQGVLDVKISEAHLGFSNLILGSDEEKALTNAVRHCFPDATFLLCTRHLQENCGRYLMKKVGVDEKHKAKVLNDIFGPNGPLSAKDIVDFEAEMADLGATYELQLPSFCLYFRDRLHGATVTSLCCGSPFEQEFSSYELKE